MPKYRVEMICYVESANDEEAFDAAYLQIADDEADEVWVNEIKEVNHG